VPLWDENGKFGNALARILTWTFAVVFAVLLLAAIATGDPSAAGSILSFAAGLFITFVVPFAVVGLACILILLGTLRIFDW
jgi:hypothetical protein